MNYGKMKPDNYIPRILDQHLERYLDAFDAVEVAGTMWCGKTWTSLAFGESVTRIGQSSARNLAEADPYTALIGDSPHVIDEWQDVPAIWDEVRNVVDTGEPGSKFILTGSSEPNKSAVHHSGAGRIAKLRMRTMTLQESGDSTGAVSLSGLFRGEFQPMQVQQSLVPLAKVLCRGGWPAIISKSQKDTPLLMDAYFDALFDINIPRRGLSGMESRRVALSLARNLGAAVKLSTVAGDANLSSADSKTATAKASAHIEALEKLFVLERISGWDAPVRAKSRVRTKPKTYFSDPSLAASLLNITPERLLSDGQLFGLLFESQCIHDLLVYSSVLPDAPQTPLHYYRDSDGLEVDAIIELRDGRWAGFEIKLGENKWLEGANSLNRLRRKVQSNPAARNRDPEFMAVIVGAGELARYDKEQDVYVIPLTALGI